VVATFPAYESRKSFSFLFFAVSAFSVPVFSFRLREGLISRGFPKSGVFASSRARASGERASRALAARVAIVDGENSAAFESGST
jgi:hypothetical protein